MESHGRYYTQALFSTLLIDQIQIINPKRIVDLGAGGGSLVKAAISRWNNTTFYAADIDKKSVAKLKKELPFVNSFHLDTLRIDVHKKLDIRLGTVDIAICNPPFLKIRNTDNYLPLLERTKLTRLVKLKTIPSEIVFLANNLQLLRADGELGIILPDSLITGKHFQLFREAILKEYDVKGIIELPEKIYPKTEALTHILIIKKKQSTGDTTPLFLANKWGEIIDEINVLKSSLVERMDFRFHSWKTITKCSFRTLGTIKAEIKRGSLTHKELDATNDTYVHTTHIKGLNEKQSLKSCRKLNKRYLLAEKGDILLARVGRDSANKICKISRGKAPISDCVYRIRVSKKYQNKVWKALSNSKGQKWLRVIAHGVCAKVISKQDLLNFPIE